MQLLLCKLLVQLVYGAQNVAMEWQLALNKQVGNCTLSVAHEVLSYNNNVF